MLRAVLFTSVLVLAGTAGAAAHAVIVTPPQPVTLGPAAIAKLRRPFPGLMGYGYESHDPHELRKRALDLTEHGYDISVSDVRLADGLRNRLRRSDDDMSGQEPIIENGRLAGVRLGHGTPLSRALGLQQGDEIVAVNGWHAALLDDQIMRNDQHAVVFEISRNGTLMVVCASWR